MTYTTLVDLLQAISDAIKQKLNLTDSNKINAQDFPAKILSIKSGSNITYTETANAAGGMTATIEEV